MAITSCYRISFLTFDLSSLSNDNSSHTLARRIQVIERLEHFLVIKLSSHIKGNQPQSQAQVVIIDNVIASKLHVSASIRCVCLPDHEDARILLKSYLRRFRPLCHFSYALSLENVQERMYAQLSRAEIPDPIQISLFLAIFAAGAQYRVTNDKPTLCSRYWQMTALYILAEQRQASESGSVEVLQTIVNLLLLMRHQQGSSKTFHLLHALSISLGSEPPTVIEEETSTAVLETSRRLRSQIERMGDSSFNDRTELC